jgi:hypothetical protein
MHNKKSHFYSPNTHKQVKEIVSHIHTIELLNHNTNGLLNRGTAGDLKKSKLGVKETAPGEKD